MTALVLVLSVAPAAAAAGEGCSVRSGARVMLRSSPFDPNVFVWDTRDRVIAYEGRLRWITTAEVLRHTILADAGTKAVVVDCTPALIHPVVQHGTADAVLVRILSGRHRGKLGWVTSADVLSRA